MLLPLLLLSPLLLVVEGALGHSKGLLEDIILQIGLLLSRIDSLREAGLEHFQVELVARRVKELAGFLFFLFLLFFLLLSLSLGLLEGWILLKP